MKDDDDDVRVLTRKANNTLSLFKEALAATKLNWPQEHISIPDLPSP